MRKLKVTELFMYGQERDGLIGVIGGNTQEHKPMIEEIREAGLDIYNIDYLTVTHDPYPEAIPILIKYLNIEKNLDILSGIARALTCPEAKGIAFEPLLKFYKEIPDSSIKVTTGLKGSIANALAYLAEKKDMITIINLLKDTNNGPSRIYFVDKIARSASKTNKNEIKELLTSLLKDEDEWIPVKVSKILKRKVFIN